MRGDRKPCLQITETWILCPQTLWPEQGDEIHVYRRRKGKRTIRMEYRRLDFLSLDNSAPLCNHVTHIVGLSVSPETGGKLKGCAGPVVCVHRSPGLSSPSISCNATSEIHLIMRPCYLLMSVMPARASLLFLRPEIVIALLFLVVKF